VALMGGTLTLWLGRMTRQASTAVELSGLVVGNVSGCELWSFARCWVLRDRAGAFCRCRVGPSGLLSLVNRRLNLMVDAVGAG
jgi:hypothetical protein